MLTLIIDTISLFFLVRSRPFMTAQLKAQSLSLGYQAQTIIRDLDLLIPAAQITVLVGANGC
ncbi:MAG: hypothetical protein ACLFV6_18005, partial [Spirulinaceae cyanobacterium]